MKRVLIIIISILVFDQVLKIWVKTNMYLGQEFEILGNWFIIHFTENEGMAFGFSFGGDTGKLMLSLFRIAAVIVIGYILHGLTVKKAHNGLIISVSLILAGAIGNIIDSCFYGVIFNESYAQTASMFPDEGGYAGFLYGRVVDMLYFPVIQGHYPDWFPVWANEQFIFFRPVFNVADSAITIGIFMIMLCQKKYFGIREEKIN